MITILGAGITGLSCSYHLGHDNCIIYEQHAHAGGHVHSDLRDGFTWDEGPHISFTKHGYVKELFAESTEYWEFEVQPTNYYQGNWIPHPAQTNLYALPEEIRKRCLEDFVRIRQQIAEKDFHPANYQEWLEYSFGKTFADNFPGVYTDRYWTTEPKNLTTDWIGTRIHFPKVEEVIKGAEAPLGEPTYHITTIRYPKHGGYFSYTDKIRKDARIRFGKKLSRISFKDSMIFFSDGSRVKYERLINTIPIQTLIQQSDAPIHVKEAATRLSCSSVLLVNVIANHPPQRKEAWMYIYDKTKYTARINHTDLLSPHNGVPGKTGIQVEVYFSKYRTMDRSPQEIADAVCNELVEMGLIQSNEAIESAHTKWCEWGNVIFDHPRREALNVIFNWLEEFGFEREYNDLEPFTNWPEMFEKEHPYKEDTKLFLAGRFAQWNYYWTDDCVLRGKYLGDNIQGIKR
jgi:protoporphyrinogen oxidase